MKKFFCVLMLIVFTLSICSCDKSENLNNFLENVVDITIGESFSASSGEDKLEITFNSVDFEQEVYSASGIFFLEKDVDEVFVVARVTIKNVGFNEVGYYIISAMADSYDRHIKLVLDNKYNYEMRLLDAEYLDSLWGIDPLKSNEFYFVESVPGELNSKPLEISFRVGDDETIYKYSQE